jgi:glycerate-2-kinase
MLSPRSSAQAWESAVSQSGGLGDLLVTGPTLTNVNDFRAVLVERA